MSVISVVAWTTTTEADAATTWREFGGLKIIVGDSVDTEGQVYVARGHFLAAPSGSEHVYVLAPKEYTVHRVPRSALETTEKGPALDIDDKSGFTSVGVLEKDADAMKWSDGEQRYSLSAKPPLIGRVTLEELLAHTKKYDFDIETYEPRAAALSALAGVETPVDIAVAFGTWCSVCAHWLPHFIKTVQSADNPNLRVTYVSVNEDLDQPADLMKTYAFDGVPIFSVRRDGQEIGRVTGEDLEEDPDAVLEQSLADIITGS